jgi:hypothetical protein
MKNYNESMLESMSNGVITLDENDIIVTCNSAGARSMQHEVAALGVPGARRGGVLRSPSSRRRSTAIPEIGCPPPISSAAITFWATRRARTGTAPG